MIVNTERNNSGIGRKAEQLPGMRGLLGREPSHSELASRLGVEAVDIPLLEEAEKHPYDRSGFKIYDISNRSCPRQIAYQKTGGIGVHRFDMDRDYAYIRRRLRHPVDDRGDGERPQPTILLRYVDVAQRCRRMAAARQLLAQARQPGRQNWP